MISIKLVGGLGNQMFQYATALHLATRLKTELVLDLSWFDNKSSIDTNRFFELDQCKIQARHQKKSIPVVASKSRLLRKAQRLALNRATPFDEQGMPFQSNVLELPDNTLLNGYFQSEKYFEDIRPLLLKSFQPSYELNQNSKDHLALIKKALNSVSLHVRRGDYITNKHAQKFHGLPGPGYYNAAVKKISSQVEGRLSIFIFSDDLPWCRKNLKFSGHDLHFVDGAQKSFDDIWLMSHCDHNIVANSSFSWWGAWLNQNKSKLVIAPTQWFQDKGVDTRDIIPSSWIKL